MARKYRGRSAPEFIAVKIYFMLEGLVAGAVLGAMSVWFLYPAFASYEFCKKTMFVIAPIGAIIGVIIAWRWTSKDIWRY